MSGITHRHALIVLNRGNTYIFLNNEFYLSILQIILIPQIYNKLQSPQYRIKHNTDYNANDNITKRHLIYIVIYHIIYILNECEGSRAETYSQDIQRVYSRCSERQTQKKEF